MTTTSRNYQLAAAGLASLVAILFIATMLAATDMRPVAPLDDAYIYFQYARQMAVGQPFEYNSGDPPTTGSTSAIYPLLLAVAYRLGFQGDNLVWPALLTGAAAFILSAVVVFRLTYLLAGAGDGRTESERNRLGLLAAALFALTGALPWSYLNGMETGLFTLFLLAALYAFAAGRPGWLALCLVLAALARPEGLALAGIAWLVTLGQWWRQPPVDRPLYSRQLLWVSAAVFAGMAPLLLNLALTGAVSATGAQAKSWLGNVPFEWQAIAGNIGRMLGFIVQRQGLGLLAQRPWPVAPGFLLLAVVGGWWLWRYGRRWTVILAAGWLLAGSLLAATLITALWQNGRYQAPFLALQIPFVALGIGALLGRLAPRRLTLGRLAVAAWLVVVVFSGAQAVATYYQTADAIDRQQLALAAAVDDLLPEDALVAVHDAGAVAYGGGRPIYDLIGLTTAGASDAWRQGSGAIFEAMGRAERRPTHFATYPDVATLPYLANTDLFARQLMATVALPNRVASTAGPSQALYEADWSTAEGAASPRQRDVAQLAGQLTPVASVNLADLADEARQGVVWTAGLPKPGFPTELHQFSYRTAADEELMDGGRLVSGKLSIPLWVEPGQPLWLAARLHAEEDGAVAVAVNGREAGMWRFPAAPGRWLENVYRIPADLVVDSEALVELSLVDADGARRPFAFYQLWAWQGTPEWPQSEPGHRLGHRFGEHVVLEGADLPPEAAVAGGLLPLKLYWRSEGQPDEDAKVFVHLYNASGELVAQVDQRPYDDTRPPFSWSPGEQIVDALALQLPGDLPPGDYMLGVGMYDPQDGRRFSAVAPDGTRLADDRLILGAVRIE